MQIENKKMREFPHLATKLFSASSLCSYLSLQQIFIWNFTLVGLMFLTKNLLIIRMRVFNAFKILLKAKSPKLNYHIS